MTRSPIFRMAREDRYRHVRTAQGAIVRLVDDPHRDGTATAELVGQLVSVARTMGGSDAAIIRRPGYYDVAIPLARVRSVEVATQADLDDHVADLRAAHALAELGRASG